MTGLKMNRRWPQVGLRVRRTSIAGYGLLGKKWFLNASGSITNAALILIPFGVERSWHEW